MVTDLMVTDLMRIDLMVSLSNHEVAVTAPSAAPLGGLKVRALRKSWP
ncbi:MAG: hypothetical protein KIT02_12090 [Devosia sp.]|nr:hypothetical protein [Devosia sp.]UYN98677.1 MAG: hypothetical protein KIT02_12090 [Devosia sp.]